MRRCYGRKHNYRHTNYHLREWHRRRRLNLQRNLLIYGVGGIIAPFIGIKLIDVLLTHLRVV